MKSKCLPHSKLGACRLPEICQLAARGRLNWTPNIQNFPTTAEIWIENCPQTLENKCKWTWKDFSAKTANQVLEKINKQRNMYAYNSILSITNTSWYYNQMHRFQTMSCLQVYFHSYSPWEYWKQSKSNRDERLDWWPPTFSVCVVDRGIH